MEAIVNQLTKLFEDLFASQALPNWGKWAAIAIVLLLVEMGHRAWLIIWFALGALGGAVVAQFFPANLSAQIGVFFAVSIISLGAFVYHRIRDENARPPTPVIPADRKVRCTEAINGTACGLIVIDGVTYKARSHRPDIHIIPDQWVFVSDFDTDELTAIVTPIDRPAPQVSG